MYSQESYFFYALTAALVMVAIVSWYYQYSMKRQYVKNLQLLRQMEQERIAVQESERRSIAADLHDEVGSILLGINLRMQGITADSEYGGKLKEEVTDHLKLVYNRITRISSQLVPPSLENNGPLYAFREFLEKFINPAPLKVEVCALDLPGLETMQSLQIYRMLQEILQNTIKHANATHLKIEARLTDEHLLISTTDDGMGFARVEAMKKGQGLRNLKMRAEMIGAELEMQSQRIMGTTYHIRIPLKKQV